MRLGEIQIGFQGVEQLILVPFHRLGDIALYQRNRGCAFRQRLIPLNIAKREGQGEQHDGGDQRLPATLRDSEYQQAADEHQQEVNRLNAHHGRQAFKRAVDLTVAEL